MIETTPTQTLDSYQNWLEQRLSPERYQHSLGAQQKAIELAEKFNLSDHLCSQAAIAGLLHDSAKLMSPQQLFEYCTVHGMPVTEEERLTPQTLHPFVGAELVKEEFGIHDDDILNAIRYHTTARAGMGLVEKIVYIADKIEGNTRNPLYIQKMTADLDFRDIETLDLTMLFILDSTITFLISKHQAIHPRTIEARNDFIRLLKDKKRL